MDRLNKLTVIIPTIGRDSLIKAYESVPKSCEVIISVDSKLDSINYKFPCKVIFSKYEPGPGFTKQSGIDNVDTEYFMILDDDDTLNPSKLNDCIELLDVTNKSWLQSNGFEDSSLNPIVVDRKKFSELLFDYDKYSPSYELNHIYTGSPGLIYRTSKFKELGLNYKYRVMDDIIPNVKLFLNSTGLWVTAKLLNYNVTTDSVSRRLLNRNEISEVNNYILNEALDSKDLLEYDVWIKSLRNFVLRRIHNNRGTPLS